MAHVTVINEHQHVQQIVSGHHHLTADEPVAAGGSDAGLAPRELLLASLGADTAVALRRHAALQTGRLAGSPSGCAGRSDAAGREHIERRLSFAKPLTAQQKQDLLGVAAVDRGVERAERRHSDPLDDRRLGQLPAPRRTAVRRTGDSLLDPQRTDVGFGALARAHFHLRASRVGQCPRQWQVVALHRDHVVAGGHRGEVVAPVGIGAYRDSGRRG